MKEFELALPLRVAQSKKKDFILNLNNYRNAHYLVLTKAKTRYADLVVALLPEWNRMRYKVATIRDDFNRDVRKIGKDDGPKFAAAYAERERPAVDDLIARYEEKYKDSVRVRFDCRVRLYHTYFHGTHGTVDTSNPCSIIEKFTCDALTKASVWPDDNMKTVTGSENEYGGVDKENPRCELLIQEVA